MKESSILHFSQYTKLLNCQSTIDKVIQKNAKVLSEDCEQRQLLEIISAAIESYVESYIMKL